MGFVDAIKVCFMKYADFNGRASRAEFWWFYLLGVIVSALAYVPYVCYLAYLGSLAMIVPQLAVAWRRMHDIGKGGGWFFICFIPVIGTIWFIILAATKGEPGPNRFGDAPAC
ncbi:MAG: DUF805 domain-containing protein [Muribaculaceae bacterium]|nr:DUF805 domain-containing protein [Muribaculaceae bacterium]